jgi:hypothetical protein
MRNSEAPAPPAPEEVAEALDVPTLRAS